MNLKEKKILITGGAGFIGQKLSSELLSQGARVRILDNFSKQVHSSETLSDCLDGHVELVNADIRDRHSVRKSLEGVEVVVHLAAETGTGQSMYEIENYFSVNCQGTAVLLDLIQNDARSKSVESMIVASSRAIYGEGAYQCELHGLVYPQSRSKANMLKGVFELNCPVCGGAVKLSPTPESAPFMPTSIYGLTKQVQEQSFLLMARTKGINGFALRYQNVYGPGQSLKNPYTGILAVFSNLARQNQRIEIYEDGKESRDFVYIDDVVDATMRSIDFSGKFVGALNVGSGGGTSVLSVAEAIKGHFDSFSEIQRTGNFRMGDIRHNIADISQLVRMLDFTPRISFSQGLYNFLNWAGAQPFEDHNAYIKSVSQLKEKGLMGSVLKGLDGV